MLPPQEDTKAMPKPIPRSQEEGSTYLRLGEKLKSQAQALAAEEGVPGGLSGAMRALARMWTQGKVTLDLGDMDR